MKYKWNVLCCWAQNGKGWLFTGYPFVRKLLQESKLKNVLSTKTHILKKVINAIWPVYNRAIIYCCKGPAEAKCSVENVLVLSNNRGYQSKP